MIEWLADPDRVNQVSAWGFLLGVVGLCLTLIGLVLTYMQARNARISSEEIQTHVDALQLRRGKSEAIDNFSTARMAMEVAGTLIQADQWREASSAYDEARRSLQKAKSVSDGMPTAKLRKLNLIVEHLIAFSGTVDNALDGKGDYPDKSTVRNAIRKNSDTISEIQQELHRGLVQ